MKNLEIAKMFDQMADVLEFQGEMVFKVNAYRKVSRILRELDRDLAAIWQAGELEQIAGIGAGLAKKIDEYLRTGRMIKYDEIISQVPVSLIELLQIQNLGPKTLALAHQKLNVTTLDDFKRVIASGKLQTLPGMGEKKVQNILRGIQLFEQAQARIPLGVALPIAQEFILALQHHPAVEQISTAGSLRRMRETVGDIDILVATKQGKEVIDYFTRLPQVAEVVAAGTTKGTVIIYSGQQVDLRAVAPESYGAALQYFTGSQAHNVRLREIAKRQGMKINEYGIFLDEQKLGGSDEEDIYRTLALAWMPPEMREDRGEIELAAEQRLPDLITLTDIQGDLHVHSKFSDGHCSIPELADKARQLSYRYLGVCDHSQSVHYAGGLSPVRLQEKLAEIMAYNSTHSDFVILAGAEVDILADGSLDYPDELLRQLDIVIAAIHSGFKQNVTQRIIAAMENPNVLILAHPTGRLISRREGYELDLEAVLQAARRIGTVLEINSFYDRLDLNDVNTRRAAELGVLFAINTDSHQLEQLQMMTFGVGVARRAWLTPQQVINSWSIQDILKLRDNKRQRL